MHRQSLKLCGLVDIGIYRKKLTYLICSCRFYTGNKDKVCQQKSEGKIEMNKIMDFIKEPLPVK